MDKKHEFGNALDNRVEDALDEIFLWANDNRGDLKPSEVMRVFEDHWGLGDIWADGWQDPDSHYGEQED